MTGLLDRTPDEILAWAESQPWVAPMRQAPMGSGGEDVWSHTKTVLHQLLQLKEWTALSEIDQRILVLAVLFHDSGRPEASESRPDRIIAPNHAPYGRLIVRRTLIHQPIHFRHRERIGSLVRWHTIPAKIHKRVRPESTVIETSWRTRPSLLYPLAVADSLAYSEKVRSSRMEQIDHYRDLCLRLDCFNHPYPFANDKARFLWFRGALPNPAARPIEDYPCEVTMLVGLPGAGKDHWYRTNSSHLPMISLDNIRKELGVSWTDDQGRVLRVAEERFTAFLKAAQSFVYNATNIDRAMRRKWVRLCRQRGARIRMIYIEPPIEVIRRQNRSRADIVDESVIDLYIEKLEVPDPTEAHEVVWV